ncbi:flagellar M-ring protein FliF, partial [Litorisediminicola beolgyonensis]
PEPASAPLTGEIDDGAGFAPLAPVAAKVEDAARDPGDEDPVDRLRGLIGERKDEAVEILRSWLDDPEEVS